MLHCISFLYYNNPSFVTSDGARALDTLLVVINCFMFIWVLGLFSIACLLRGYRNRAIRLLSASVASSVLGLQRKLRAQKDALIAQLTQLNHRDEKHLVPFADFKTAVEKCLATSESPAVLESAYAVLTLLHVDHSCQEDMDLTTTMRQAFMKDLGVPYQLVLIAIPLSVNSPCSVPTPFWVQILEFVGASRGLASHMSRKRLVSEVGSALDQSQPRDQKHDSHEAHAWNARQVRRVAEKISHEIGFSLFPVSMYGLVNRRMKSHEDGHPAELLDMFRLSAWLAPHIPDTADIGAYSNGNKAKVYRQIAARLPRLLLLSSFGSLDVLKSIASFIEHMEVSESTFSDDDVAVFDLVSEKDKGPFLYWLVNERCFAREASRSLGCRSPFVVRLRVRELTNRTRLHATESQRGVFSSIISEMHVHSVSTRITTRITRRVSQRLDSLTPRSAKAILSPRKKKRSYFAESMKYKSDQAWLPAENHPDLAAQSVVLRLPTKVHPESSTEQVYAPRHVVMLCIEALQWCVCPFARTKRRQFQLRSSRLLHEMPNPPSDA